MDTLDVVEVWTRSLTKAFEAGGVEVRCQRSPLDRANPSIAVNLRSGDTEADLIVWESGHADLSLMGADGKVAQHHFEDVRNVEASSEVLAAMAGMLRPVAKAKSG